MEIGARIDPNKVAAYIRWSTDDQAQGTTLEVQKAACEYYIRSQGWNFRDDLVFVDDGYSGATLDRPGLKALREAVAGGRVECVVMYTLDRLSRSVADTVDLVLKEWEGKCHVRCVQQPIDTSQPTGKMFFYMLASYAEFERDMIRMRTLGGKQRRAKEGANAGWRYNYGYKKLKKGTYEIEPDEAEVVRWLFREYVAGKSFKQLAIELNRKGIPSPEGKIWNPTSVRSVITNPVYIGRIEYGKEKRVLREGKVTYLRSSVPRYAAVDGAVPPLVGRELWEEVQRRRRERARVHRRSLASAYLLSGLARCARCGARIVGVTAKGVRFYRCTGRRQFGDDYCDSAVIRADVVEGAVLQKLKEELQGEAVREALVSVLRQYEEERKAAQAHLALLLSQRNSVVQARKRLDQAFDKGDLDPKLYCRREQELAQKLEEVNRQVAEAEAKLRQLQASAPDPEAVEKLASRVDAWDFLSDQEKKALFRDAVGEVKVYRKSNGKFARNDNPVEVHVTVRV